MTFDAPNNCPTCGQRVESIFDHVDRDEIDPATGYCREPTEEEDALHWENVERADRASEGWTTD